MNTGKEITDALAVIEKVIIDHEVNNGEMLKYGEEAARAATKIFMSVMMERMYLLQIEERFEIKDAMNMARSMGDSLRSLIKTYTGLDTTKMYELCNDELCSDELCNDEPCDNRLCSK
jgi:hypothetical protein